MHRQTGPASGIMVWGGIGYHSRTPLVRIAGTLNNQRYISEIELLPWPSRSPGLSPMENMWSVVAQRLTQITPPAATPDQLWQRVEAAWSSVPQEHIQSLFESMPRNVAERYHILTERSFALSVGAFGANRYPGVGPLTNAAPGR
ncbi:transposable element Tcb1 transposase [Trichonephila clavipes]|nr:transposable element Tcb1 transposase [Trichonephila clavipes]